MFWELVHCTSPDPRDGHGGVDRAPSTVWELSIDSNRYYSRLEYSTFHSIAKTRFGTTSRRWHGFVAVDPAQASSARREVDVLLVSRRAAVYAKRLPSPEGVRFV